MKYKHLSLEGRVELYAGMKLGIANRRAAKWVARQRYKAPLKNPQTLSYVLEKLKLGWSPETISGRIGIDNPELSVSYESIYRWIYFNKYWKRDQLWRYLECGHRKRRKKHGRKVNSYTQIPDIKTIDLRLDLANLRLQMGHGETDLMESSRNSQTALSVTADRLTRMASLVKVKDKTSRSKTAALARLAAFGIWFMTADRGPENKKYPLWETKLGMSVYFCHPYHSWEKGTVENTIKRIRRLISKGSDVSQYSWREIKKIEYWLNHKPMKCLQYLTPYEKMQQELTGLKSEA